MRRWKKGGDNTKKRAAIICIGILAAVSAVLMAVKEDGANDAAAIAFYENEAMRTADTPVTMAEFMLYAVDIKSGYDESMGKSF